MDFFWDPGKGSKTVLGYTHVVEQLLFSMFPSLLTSDLTLFFGLFLTICVPNGIFLGSGYGLKTDLGSTYVVEQLFPTFLQI